MKAEVYFVAANLILDKHLSSDVWFSKTFLEEMMVFIHYSFYAGLFESVIHNIPKSKAESIVKPLAVYQIKGWNRFAEEMEVMGLGELGKSQEDYLEAILVLQNQHSEVLSIDVARHMNFSKPSVCHAVKQLKGKGFLDVYEDGSETYMIKKGRLSLNLRPPYSKDRIHKATERIIEEQKEQSKDS